MKYLILSILKYYSLTENVEKSANFWSLNPASPEIQLIDDNLVSPFWSLDKNKTLDPEGDPPLWTIVNNSTPMNSAVNVITGTRITHGHPLLIG